MPTFDRIDAVHDRTSKWPRALALMIMALLMGLATTPSAAAEAVDTVDFPGAVTCTVKADDPHASIKPIGDISGKINVECRRWDSRELAVVDRIDVESTLSYYPGGVLLFGETVQTCSGGKGFRYSFGLPCHGPWQGDGRYSLDGTVTITFQDDVKSTTVGKSGYLAGGNSGPVA